ncbi:hypothetical protein HDU93_008718 [Gonapodya sp. JEL0774]|nr:hypothetical protein HDU93_008718 [Gonapodya sp. JEL0774]
MDTAYSRFTRVLAEQESILRELAVERERYNNLYANLDVGTFDEEQQEHGPLHQGNSNVQSGRQEQSGWDDSLMENLLDLPTAQLDQLMAAISTARSVKSLAQENVAFELVRGTTVDTKSVEARADFPIDFDVTLRGAVKQEGGSDGENSDEADGEEVT